MRCRSAQTQLSSLIDHELTTWKRWFVSRHLGTCDSCQRRLERLNTARQAFLQIEPESPSAGFDRRLLLRLQLARQEPREEPATNRPRLGRHRSYRPLWLAATTAGLLVALVWPQQGDKLAIEQASTPPSTTTHLDISWREGTGRPCIESDDGCGALQPCLDLDDCSSLSWAMGSRSSP